MNNRQLGRFKIDAKLIREHPEDAIKIFRLFNCVVVRAQQDFATDAIEYTALAERFEPLQAGAIIPEYEVTIGTDKTGAPMSLSVAKVTGDL